jgi:uncharacterized protein (TIGR02647 family)
MSFTPENRAELTVLMLYKSATHLDGIKIHKSADPDITAAAQRLYDGGFITQVDGGYLTPLGSTAAEHAHLLFELAVRYAERPHLGPG